MYAYYPGAPHPSPGDYTEWPAEKAVDVGVVESSSTWSDPWKLLAGIMGLITLGLLGSTIALGVLYADRTKTETVFATTDPPSGTNNCAGTDPGLASIACFDSSGAVQALEQSGVNVTSGYQGSFNASGRTPITTPYWAAGLCPVNVHFHLGTEHLSVGQYDSTGTGPTTAASANRRQRASGDLLQGYQCLLYDSSDSKFTTEYNWQHCIDVEVGQTYEVHWPHSAAGACGTINQYQTPFPDGVFCNWATVGNTTYEQIGVQAQVFVVVNDESYYYPDLIRGMIVDVDGKGSDVAIYTGSTTGTSVSNTVCSSYAPITWQVDRTCHLISASSFDKMCADMKAQRDDMTSDLSPSGSRQIVIDSLAANNQVSADFTASPYKA